MDINQEAFFALLRAGLFPIHGEGVMVHDSSFKDVDWEKVYLLAQEQSVQGLVLQGIETVQGSWFSFSSKGAAVAVDWRGSGDRAAE